MKDLKQLAARHLNARSSLRRLILSQLGELPREIAMSKMVDFPLLLKQEIRG